MATPKSISTIKSFRLLRAFRRPGEALSTAQLSRRAGLPASSVRRLLLTLGAIGAVERAGATRFRLGPMLLSLGACVQVEDCLLAAARAALLDLHGRLGQPVAMAVLKGGMAHYLIALAPPGPGRIEAGAQYEAYSSAIGRVLLAALPPPRMEQFLQAGELVPLTPFTITAPDALRAELARIRLEGFAVEREETRIGLGGVAAPIRDAHGRTYAAICVSDAACALSPSRIASLRDDVLAAAAEIQQELFPAIAARPVQGKPRFPAYDQRAMAAE